MQKKPYKAISKLFSAEILQTKSMWHNIFEVLKVKKNYQEFSAQQSYHSELKGRLKVSQVGKR